MSLYKRGKVWWFKFRLQGRGYCSTTRCNNRRDAASVEAKIRSEVALGNFDILKREPAPTVTTLLKDSFMPFVEARFSERKNTRDYYFYGTGMLTASKLSELRVDEITSEHIARYISEHKAIQSPSTINQGLRTLRRAVRLAQEWGKIARAPKITLAAGEGMRTRILTQDEEKLYLEAASEPWRTIATIMLDLGMRPGEIRILRAEHLSWDDRRIRILFGKSSAARRILPMTARVYESLHDWWQQNGSPANGWIFRSKKFDGPVSAKVLHDWHCKAIQATKVKRFEPYCMRHTALTRLSLFCDSSTLAAIAGHSSPVITQRYIHTQELSIQDAFERKAGYKIGDSLKRRRFSVVAKKEQSVQL